MTTMESVDKMFREAAAVQGQTQELEELQPADLPITGVQLNEMSKSVTIYHRLTGAPRIMPAA